MRKAQGFIDGLGQRASECEDMVRAFHALGNEAKIYLLDNGWKPRVDSKDRVLRFVHERHNYPEDISNALKKQAEFDKEKDATEPTRGD